MKNPRALTFDLDDTLWDNGPVLMAAEQALYDWLGRHYPRIQSHFSLEDLRKLPQELVQRDPDLGDTPDSGRKGRKHGPAPMPESCGWRITISVASGAIKSPRFLFSSYGGWPQIQRAPLG